MDVVDAAALYAFAVAAVDASAVFGLVFAALWFRSLYGSARAAVLRCGLYVVAVAVAAVAPTSHHVFGGWRSIGAETLLGVVPIMFVTMIVGRRLAASVVARERTAEFDAVYTSVGYQLLGVSDEAAIRRIAREANERICRVTPGLRVLKLSAAAGTLRVVSASGEWSDVPDALPADVLEGPEGARGASAWYLRGAAEHDGAAGARCRWLCLRLQQVPGEGVEGWVLLGAPGDVPSEAIAAVTSVANHVTLALSNSYVHQSFDGRRPSTV